MNSTPERAEHIYSATLFPHLHSEATDEVTKTEILEHITYEMNMAIEQDRMVRRRSQLKHFHYARYVALHKYYVFVGCRRLGVGMVQSLIHDWSKLLPVEWIPYTNHFYGAAPIQRDATGYYDASKQDEAFVYAWLHHQHLNKHHWQHWMLKQDDGSYRLLEMPERYVREMVGDWFGAGMTQSIIEKWSHKPNPKKWYERNRDKIKLHPRSIEILLPLLDIADTWPECN
jgi:hypothetical protein